MLEPFFLEINSDGQMMACKEHKNSSVYECQRLNEVKDLFDFIG